MMRRLVTGIVFLCVSTAPLAGQNLRDQVRHLLKFGNCGGDTLICLAPLTGVHGSHFNPAANEEGRDFLRFISSSIGISVSNTPISSSSSGTTFKFVGGAPVKTSTSAGPILAERAQTLGRGRWFVGADLTQMNFERLRGVPLNRITFNFEHQTGADSVLGSPNFENDYIAVKVAMDVNLLVASLSLTYGLVDGIDIGVTLPFVRTSLHGNSEARIFPADPAEIDHYFAGDPTNPVLTAVSSADGVASGLGDVEGRLKINVAQGARISVAVFGAARFPTGDTTNLLGAGGFAGRGLAVVSGQFGDFNPHVNIGFTVRDATSANNSVESNAGFDALLAPWATMAFDVLGSWQIGASKLEVPPPVIYRAPVVRSLDVTNIPDQRDDYMSLSVGFKFQTRRGIQIVTNTLFPLRDSGLQPSVMWTGGLEYNF